MTAARNLISLFASSIEAARTSSLPETGFARTADAASCGKTRGFDLTVVPSKAAFEQIGDSSGPRIKTAEVAIGVYYGAFCDAADLAATINEDADAIIGAVLSADRFSAGGLSMTFEGSSLKKRESSSILTLKFQLEYEEAENG